MEALEMETPMNNWNDVRLDELNSRVDDGFTKVDERFEKIDERFEKVASKEEMKEVKVELQNLGGRIDRLLHAFALIGVTFGIGVLGSIGGVVVALH